MILYQLFGKGLLYSRVVLKSIISQYDLSASPLGANRLTYLGLYLTTQRNFQKIFEGESSKQIQINNSPQKN